MTKRGRPRHPDILTPREWEVLDLLREGLSNDEIGGRLGITERTAKYHVSEILSKLGVGSRSEAAAWQPDRRPAWWLAAGAPIAFLWRKASLSWLSGAVSGGLVVVTLGGLALLAVLLLRNGDGEAIPVIGAVVAQERIAFSIAGNIYSVRPDGSDLQLIVGENDTTYSAPEYSSDGERLAYIADRRRVEVIGSDPANVLSAVDLFVDRTPPTPIASDFSMGPVAVHWSPDGERLLVTRQRLGGSGASDVVLLNADGGDLRLVHESGVFIEGTWWRPPDGEPLVLVVAGDASMSAITYDLDGGEAGRALPATATRPAVASLQHPDGDRALVRSTLGSPEPFGPIEVEDAAGASIVAGGCGATWSPDGSRIAFYNGDGIMIKDPATPPDDVELILSNEDLLVQRRIITSADVCIGLGITWPASTTIRGRATTSYRDDGLGIEFEYPAAWVEGAPDSPVRPCLDCTVFGPPNSLERYGVRLYPQELTEGCTSAGCLVGNGRRQLGPVREVEYGGHGGLRVDIIANPPLGLVDEVGTANYYEVWTAVRRPGRDAVFLVAFYREDDAVSGQKTIAAYEALLASLVVE